MINLIDMRPENQRLDSSDTGMCPHGNFKDNCTTCKEEQERFENQSEMSATETGENKTEAEGAMLAEENPETTKEMSQNSAEKGRSFLSRTKDSLEKGLGFVFGTRGATDLREKALIALAKGGGALLLGYAVTRYSIGLPASVPSKELAYQLLAATAGLGALDLGATLDYQWDLIKRNRRLGWKD